MEIKDISGEEDWKKEVARLLDENYYLHQELVASQLMTGLILKVAGPVTVGRGLIADGLPGYSIELEESKDGSMVTFKLVQNAEQ